MTDATVATEAKPQSSAGEKLAARFPGARSGDEIMLALVETLDAVIGELQRHISLRHETPASMLAASTPPPTEPAASDTAKG